MPHFELGKKLKDRVTGYEGIATHRLEHLNGCIQYGVTGPVDKDGKIPDAYYVDHAQLEQIGDGIEVDQADTGGATTKVPRNGL